jgi:hypothetical protein
MILIRQMMTLENCNHYYYHMHFILSFQVHSVTDFIREPSSWPPKSLSTHSIRDQRELKCNISDRTESEKIFLQKRSTVCRDWISVIYKGESLQTKWLQDNHNYWDVPVFGYMRVRVCYESVGDEVDGNEYEVEKDDGRLEDVVTRRQRLGLG